MWMWHQVEEIEHGAVAFDVYKQLYGRHEWYRKWTILHALTHIAVQTLKTYPHMAKVEGWLRNPFKGAAKLWFCVHMLLRLLHAALPVFRRGYDPRKHPIATTAQDPIQVAWRRFEAADGNVLKIDHARDGGDVPGSRACTGGLVARTESGGLFHPVFRRNLNGFPGLRPGYGSRSSKEKGPACGAFF
jgi:hypothetical protein